MPVSPNLFEIMLSASIEANIEPDDVNVSQSYDE
jgi:hypothetical protein